MKEKVVQRRYLKVSFFGYLPADLAIECHLALKDSVKNEVGGVIKPYEEYEKDYELKLKHSEYDKKVLDEKYIS